MSFESYYNQYAGVYNQPSTKSSAQGYYGSSSGQSSGSSDNSKVVVAQYQSAWSQYLKTAAAAQKSNTTKAPAAETYSPYESYAAVAAAQQHQQLQQQQRRGGSPKREYSKAKPTQQREPQRQHGGREPQREQRDGGKERDYHSSDSRAPRHSSTSEPTFQYQRAGKSDRERDPAPPYMPPTGFPVRGFPPAPVLRGYTGPVIPPYPVPTPPMPYPRGQRPRQSTEAPFRQRGPVNEEARHSSSAPAWSPQAKSPQQTTFAQYRKLHACLSTADTVRPALSLALRYPSLDIDISLHELIARPLSETEVERIDSSAQWIAAVPSEEHRVPLEVTKDFALRTRFIRLVLLTASGSEPNAMRSSLFTLSILLYTRSPKEYASLPGGAVTPEDGEGQIALERAARRIAKESLGIDVGDLPVTILGDLVYQFPTGERITTLVAVDGSGLKKGDEVKARSLVFEREIDEPKKEEVEIPLTPEEISVEEVRQAEAFERERADAERERPEEREADRAQRLEIFMEQWASRKQNAKVPTVRKVYRTVIVRRTVDSLPLAPVLKNLFDIIESEQPSHCLVDDKRAAFETKLAAFLLEESLKSVYLGVVYDVLKDFPKELIDAPAHLRSEVRQFIKTEIPREKMRYVRLFEDKYHPNQVTREVLDTASLSVYGWGFQKLKERFLELGLPIESAPEAHMKLFTIQFRSQRDVPSQGPTAEQAAPTEATPQTAPVESTDASPIEPTAEPSADTASVHNEEETSLMQQDDVDDWGDAHS